MADSCSNNPQGNQGGALLQAMGQQPQSGPGGDCGCGIDQPSPTNTGWPPANGEGRGGHCATCPPPEGAPSGPGPGIGPIIPISVLSGAKPQLNQAVSVAQAITIPTGSLYVSSPACQSIEGQCLVNTPTGNLSLQAAPPNAGTLAANPVLTYNSQAATSGVTEFGNNWTMTYRRYLVVGGSFQINIFAGDGTKYTWSGSGQVGGYFTPLSGNPVNSLSGTFGTNYTETQPDGTAYFYNSAGTLQYIKNVANARWSLTHDAGGRVTRVTDPFSRLTTFAYNATSNKIKRIQDSSGRITSFTVNASGNLAKIVTPALCIHSLNYDASNRPTSWIDPLGNRTSYLYDGLHQPGRRPDDHLARRELECPGGYGRDEPPRDLHLGCQQTPDEHGGRTGATRHVQLRDAGEPDQGD